MCADEGFTVIWCGTALKLKFKESFNTNCTFLSQYIILGLQLFYYSFFTNFDLLASFTLFSTCDMMQYLNQCTFNVHIVWFANIFSAWPQFLYFNIFLIIVCILLPYLAITVD